MKKGVQKRRFILLLMGMLALGQMTPSYVNAEVTENGAVSETILTESTHATADSEGVMYLTNQSMLFNNTGQEQTTLSEGYKIETNQNVVENIRVSDSDDWSMHVASSFSGGAGSEISPYLIQTAEELALMAKYVNEYNPTYRSAYYKLTNNIDLNAYNWIPAGNGSLYGDSVQGNSNFFYGHFDGDNYSISGMNISKDEKIYFYGLFGCICGTVENVILKDARIEVNSFSEGWYSSNGMGSAINVGGLAGEVTGFSKYDAEIKNCICDADINFTAVNSISAGGLVGDINYGTVINTVTRGDINVTSARAIWCGGVTGHLGNESEITQSSFNGGIKTKNDGNLEDEEVASQGYSWLHYVGGFAGCVGRATSNKILSDDYAVADISSESKQHIDAGGFTGVIEVVYDNFEMKNLFCKSLVKISDYLGQHDTFYDFTKSNVTGGSFRENTTNINISNCGYIVNDDIYLYQNQNEQIGSDDGYKTFSLKANNSYSMKTEDTEKLFVEQLGFDTDIWSIRKGTYPILQIEQPGIELSDKNIALSKNEFYQLIVKTLNIENSAIKWESSNKDVALVDDTGKVEGVSPGTATITCTEIDSGKISASCEVTVNKEKDDVPSDGELPTVEGSVVYTTHVQNVGWQDMVADGVMSGTKGKGLRLEAIKIESGIKGVGIKYSTHVQNVGWQDFVSDGKLSGTSGRGLRLEGIRINLTGEQAENYDVVYRVHAQNVGWMGWASNGADAGTAGYGYRLEGIEIQIVKKGTFTGDTENAFKDAADENRWKLLYLDKLQKIKAEDSNLSYKYFLNDLNGDGSSELIVKATDDSYGIGTCNVYKISDDKISVQKLNSSDKIYDGVASAGGYRSFLSIPQDGNGLYITSFYSIKPEVDVDRINVSANSLVQTDVSTFTMGSAELKAFNAGNMQVQWLDIDDTQALS